jgi:hypothetical protein
MTITRHITRKEYEEYLEMKNFHLVLSSGFDDCDMLMWLKHFNVPSYLSIERF